jgi:hypothetical protein
VLLASVLCAALSFNGVLSQQASAANHTTVASTMPSSLTLMKIPLSAVFSAHTASSSGWIAADADDFSLLSADHKAQAIGTVQWYHGKFPRGYLHRGEYTWSPIVVATHPVGCIWTQITWGYPMGSVSFPPGASIQSAEKVDGFFVACRGSGSRFPAVLMLNGLAYAKAFLNSTTLTICTSATKREGPRNCGTKKMYYGLG